MGLALRFAVARNEEGALKNSFDDTQQNVGRLPTSGRPRAVAPYLPPILFLRRRPQKSGVQTRCFAASCARRAFTIFLTSAVGKGLSSGNWMVPLEVG